MPLDRSDQGTGVFFSNDVTGYMGIGGDVSLLRRVEKELCNWPTADGGCSILEGQGIDYESGSLFLVA